MKRSRVRPVSDARLAEAEERRAVVERAKLRAGYRCELEHLGGCFGDLVGHELAHRSVYKGSHLIDDLVVALCVGHNGWEDVQTNTVAQEAGVRVSAWAVIKFGTAAIGEECRRIRRARRLGDDPGVPLWDRDDPPPPPPGDPSLLLVPADTTVQVSATGLVSAASSADLFEQPDPF